jgi:cobalt-precorrin 5A hydrolase / precorrin-3B C17-methyltransferase
MDTGSRTVIFYITDRGRCLAERINRRYPGAEVIKFRSSMLRSRWEKAGTFLCIMAAGIVVREIAPVVGDKKTDPAVIVLDEKGEYVISLLSGHLGGANERAREIAAFLGGKAVITTASDVGGITSIDLWAERNGLRIENWDTLPKISTKLLNTGSLPVYADEETSFHPLFRPTDDPDEADIIISRRKNSVTHRKGRRLYLRPMNLVVGIGCNSGTHQEEIDKAVRTVLNERNLSFLSVCTVATIDKKGKEPGLVAFARGHSFPLITFTPDELNSVKNVTVSDVARQATGAQAVAEPAALLAAHAESLLVSKRKIGNVTVAVAERMKQDRNHTTQGKISVVGTGPGSIEHITPYARTVIRNSDVIVGYGTYLDIIRELIRDKTVLSTGMTQEVDRCRKAIELASEGKNVSVVSGGDPGIYAMAGLVLELLKSSNTSRVDSPLHIPHSSISVEVIPGISALNACAARLGAPLMHDFASISLSDRLTPWDMIEKRLEAAASADFVIVLYNPKSKGRAEQIGRAREIIMRHRSPDTPTGIVKAAMREEERVIVTDLMSMLSHEIDMQTTVIIGNSQSFAWGGWMITPRGYERKRQYAEKG